MMHIKLVEGAFLNLVQKGFFAMRIFDWPITKRFLKCGGSPTIEVFTPNIYKHMSPNIQPTISKKTNCWAKPYGTKWGAIVTMLGNTLRAWRTCWEPTGNLVWGTKWEFDENTLGTTKSKKLRPNTHLPRGHWVHAVNPHWLSRISSLNWIHHLF